MNQCGTGPPVLHTPSRKVLKTLVRKLLIKIIQLFLSRVGELEVALGPRPSGRQQGRGWVLPPLLLLAQGLVQVVLDGVQEVGGVYKVLVQLHTEERSKKGAGGVLRLFPAHPHCRQQRVRLGGRAGAGSTALGAGCGPCPAAGTPRPREL